MWNIPPTTFYTTHGAGGYNVKTALDIVERTYCKIDIATVTIRTCFLRVYLYLDLPWDAYVEY